VEGSVDRDAGAMIRDGIKVMEKLGVCPASRRNGEAAWKRMVTWGFHGKIWENDGKIMMYGTSWPNWRSRSSVSRLAYGRTVWSRVFFFGNTYSAILQDGVSGVSAKAYGTTAEEKQWKYDDQHDFFKKQPDKSCHSTGLKGTCSTIQLWCYFSVGTQCELWLWMSLRRSSRKNHHETSSICMYCINVNINVNININK
jgi:hypothetical protein